MIDEIYDRAYQDSRHALNADLDRFFGRLARDAKAVFTSVHRINFAAPWLRRRKTSSRIV